MKTDNETELKLAGKFMKKGFTDAQAKLKAVWEQPNIASICTEMPNMTLLMSNVAAAMDSDGNGKGEMWIGAPGWASANVNEVKPRDYGLLDFIEPLRAEEAVKTARIKDSIAKGEGYVAIRIRQIALDAGVPVVESCPDGVEAKAFGFVTSNRLAQDSRRGLVELNTGDFARYDAGFSVGGPISRTPVRAVNRLTFSPEAVSSSSSSAASSSPCACSPGFAGRAGGSRAPSSPSPTPCATCSTPTFAPQKAKRCPPWTT